MEIADLKGLVIFTGIFAVLGFVLTGIMGRSVDRIVRVLESQAKEDDKYIN